MGRDAFANLIGQGWTLGLQFLAVPFYLTYLGDAYFGIISFYFTILVVTRVLDLGLAPTLNRAFASGQALNRHPIETKDLLRSTELVYWTVGLTIGLTVFWTAPWLASTWLQVGRLPTSEVANSLGFMGLLLAIQWPLLLYENGLMGLGKHTRLNALRFIGSTVTVGSSVWVSTLPGASVRHVFVALTLGAALQVVATGYVLWSSLPATSSWPRFRWSALRKIRGFAAGMAAITVTAMLLTQTDRIVLSSMLSLEEFGRYNVARTLGSTVAILAQPIFQSVFPRLSSTHVTGDLGLTAETYRNGLIWLVSFMFPIAIAILALPAATLYAWTGDLQLSYALVPITVPFLLGSWINGTMVLPYALQLSHGWTSLGVWVNSILICFSVPAVFFLTRSFGPVGAAHVWLWLNVLYALLTISRTHDRLLPGTRLADILRDNRRAFFVLFGVGVLARIFFPDDFSRPGAALAVAATACVAAVGTTLVAPDGSEVAIARKHASQRLAGWTARFRIGSVD